MLIESIKLTKRYANHEKLVQKVKPPDEKIAFVTSQDVTCSKIYIGWLVRNFKDNVGDPFGSVVCMASNISYLRINTVPSPLQ
jgi:hypothetical protein